MMEFRPFIGPRCIAMGIDMNQAHRLLVAQRLQDRISDRMVAADRKRNDARSGDAAVESLDILMTVFKAETASERDVPDIRSPPAGHGSHFQGMLVWTDPFHGPDCPWPQSRTGPVGYPKVHRDADKRNVEAVEVDSVRSFRTVGNAKEGGNISKRPFALVAIAELLVRNSPEGRIVDVSTFGIGIFFAKGLELFRVCHRMPNLREGGE